MTDLQRTPWQPALLYMTMLLYTKTPLSASQGRMSSLSTPLAALAIPLEG
jgi:hypothetical protein